MTFLRAVVFYKYDFVLMVLTKGSALEFKQNETLRDFDRLNRQIDELYHEIAAKRGLSDSAYGILQAMLVLGEGCTQTAVCRYACLNKQTVNSSVRRMVQDGLIELRRGEGREMHMHLTVQGKRMMRERVLPVERAESEVFDEMPVEDQRTILRLMSHYLDSFRHKVNELEVTR